MNSLGIAFLLLVASLAIACGSDSKEPPPPSAVLGVTVEAPTPTSVPPTPIPTPTPVPLVACQLTPAGVFSDDEVKIVKPAAAVPANLAALSGVWEGKWNGAVPSTLIFQTVNATQPEGFYAFNNVRSGNQVFLPQPDGTFKSPSQEFTWVLVGDTLRGTLLRAGTTSTIAMTRCDIAPR